MKKLLAVSLLTLSLGGIAFARGHHNNYYDDGYGHSGYGCSGYGHSGYGYKGIINSNPVIQQLRIQLEENRLAIMKEMAKTNPNFATVGKLNQQRAEIQAKLRTERMKLRYELDKSSL